MRRRVIQLYIKNNEVIFSLAWNIIFFDNFKSSCFEIFGDKERDIFEPKSWWKYDIYWLLKSSCFNLFGNGKYGLFLSQKVDWKMIFTDYWEVLVLNFLVIGNRSFFQPKSWWKADIYIFQQKFPVTIIRVNIVKFIYKVKNDKNLDMLLRNV